MRWRTNLPGRAGKDTLQGNWIDLKIRREGSRLARHGYNLNAYVLRNVA